MNINNFKTIEIYNNLKAPIKKWTDARNQYKGRPTTTINYGIITGKINNIIVIDFDCYKRENPEYKALELFKEYKDNVLNTYTVLTPRGGLHYYFKYDDEIRATQNDKYNIDIKSDGGYIIGAGSKIDNKEYKIIHDVSPAKLPEDIKRWLLTNLYTAEKKLKTLKGERKTKTNDNNNNRIINEYNLTSTELKNIVGKLPAKYWTMDDNGFLKYTTFMKYFNLYDLWDETNKTKPNYNYENNMNMFWNTASITGDNIYSIIDSVLYDAGGGSTIYTSYYKYRPIPINTTTPDLILYENDLINGRYLNVDIIKRDTNYMIKSDTGTGKTTLFKKYIKNTGDSFISIVSRVSLADEQYRVFNEYGITDLKHYNYDARGSLNNFNIVIQIDSILKLRNLDFTNYVIFLDEINSIIHHLIMCPTLNDKRAIIYKLFVKILQEAKQIIGTDADINDTSLNFLKRLCKFKYIQNTRKHNKGVPATEIKNLKMLIEQLRNEDKFMLATDSATMAETIYNELEKNKTFDMNNTDDDRTQLKLITSYTTQYELDLDKHDRIIFSPKILYGLDSTIERPVYCYYKEHTINPTAYIQQISRCRNITHLYYTFETKTYKHINTTKQDIYDNVSINNILTERLYTLKELLSAELYKHYLRAFVSYEYINVCYNSNKFGHFIKLLHDRGFIINSTVYTLDRAEKKQTKKMTKEAKEQKLLNFNYNEYPIKHKMLNIPDNDTDAINKYKEYYINEYLLKEHNNIIKTVNNTRSQLRQKIENTDGTKNNIITSTDNKILLLKRIKKEFKIKDFKTITASIDEYKKVKDTTKETLYEEYKQAFKSTSKHNFNTLDGLNKCIKTMYGNLYGKIIKSNKQNNRDPKTKKVKTTYIYTFDDDFYNFNIELYNYRKNKRKRGASMKRLV